MMEIKRKVGILTSFMVGLTLFLGLVSSVNASPDKNPVFATIDYVKEAIDKAVDRINSRLNNQDKRIAALEARVTALEATPTLVPSPTLTPTPTPTPVPVTLTFVSGASTPYGNSDAISIPTGYKSLTFSVTFNGSIANWVPQVSFDGGSTWFEQVRFSCGATCASVTIPIIGSKYRFSLGSASVSNLNVTVVANSETNANVLLLGQNISYPFTSSTFSTNGFTSIVITAGAINNPQNLTGISLQRFEGGIFVEKQHLSCDGGAQCPLTSLPVLGGDYRVVLEGNGLGAVLGAILRP